MERPHRAGGWAGCGAKVGQTELNVVPRNSDLPQIEGSGHVAESLWQTVLQTLHVGQVCGEGMGPPTCNLMLPMGLKTSWTWHPGLWSRAPRHPHS